MEGLLEHMKYLRIDYSVHKRDYHASFRTGAAATFWSYRELAKWLKKELTKERQFGIDYLTRFTMRGYAPLVQAWSYRPEGSKVQKLPNWKYWQGDPLASVSEWD